MAWTNTRSSGFTSFQLQNGHAVFTGDQPISHGTDKGNAIINCHLPHQSWPGDIRTVSITGQPSMGGREVGGLANQLAAYGDRQPRSPALGQ